MLFFLEKCKFLQICDALLDESFSEFVRGRFLLMRGDHLHFSVIPTGIDLRMTAAHLSLIQDMTKQKKKIFAGNNEI